MEQYDFNEIFRLRFLLDEAGIEYEFIDRSFAMHDKIYKSYQICCPKKFPLQERYVSVIQSFGSYGREKDLLEIMGLLTDVEMEVDETVGYLTAEDVFERIKKYNEEKKDGS